jgi:hypothetical protein
MFVTPSLGLFRTLNTGRYPQIVDGNASCIHNSIGII